MSDAINSIKGTLAIPHYAYGDNEAACEAFASLRLALDEIESLTAERDKYKAEAHLLTDERDALTAEGKIKDRLITAAVGALTYYTEVEYHENSDVQSGYGLEVLGEIEDALAKLGSVSDSQRIVHHQDDIPVLPGEPMYICPKCNQIAPGHDFGCDGKHEAAAESGRDS